jgi:fructose-1,6-bisphosphatase I
VSIGTIFSIYKKQTPSSEPLQESDFLQKGRTQIAAGYILYGASTMLVFSTGNGVNGFTYETTLGEYVLSHPSMVFNNANNYFSMNEGLSFDLLDKGVTTYINECKEKRMSGRYIGSLVADFHRNLLKGGIFLYPRTNQYPNGKLRLLFEANAMAFLAEQAGGLAFANETAILDIQPTSIHQTVPFYTGPKEMVSTLLAHLNS